MRKITLLCLCMTILLASTVIGLALSFGKFSLQPAHVRAKGFAQANTGGIEWNNTDCNATFVQSTYSGPQTLPPRVTVEYGDFTMENNLTSGVPDFQILPRIVLEYADAAFQFYTQPPQGLNQILGPRIMIEYADYDSFMDFPVQPYPNPPNRTLFPLFIDKPFPPPPSEVPENQSVTVSVNVTGILSLVNSASLNYTTNGVSWNKTDMTLVQQYAEANSTVCLYQATIPGQLADTWVNYSISAYDNAGNYAENNNAGRYFVYDVVVPEFPSAMLPILFVGATLSAVIAYRKRRELTN